MRDARWILSVRPSNLNRDSTMYVGTRVWREYVGGDRNCLPKRRFPGTIPFRITVLVSTLVRTMGEMAKSSFTVRGPRMERMR